MVQFESLLSSMEYAQKEELKRRFYFFLAHQYKQTKFLLICFLL